jgi:hypothetical protein
LRPPLKRGSDLVAIKDYDVIDAELLEGSGASKSGRPRAHDRDLVEARLFRCLAPLP